MIVGEIEASEPIGAKFTPELVGDGRVTGEIELLEVSPAGVKEPEVGFGGDLGVGYWNSDLEGRRNGDFFGLPVDIDESAGGIEANGFVIH